MQITEPSCHVCVTCISILTVITSPRSVCLSVCLYFHDFLCWPASAGDTGVPWNTSWLSVSWFSKILHRRHSYVLRSTYNAVDFLAFTVFMGSHAFVVNHLLLPFGKFVEKAMSKKSEKCLSQNLQDDFSDISVTGWQDNVEQHWQYTATL